MAWRTETPLFHERQRFVGERLALALVALGGAASILGAIGLLANGRSGGELVGGIVLVTAGIGLPLLFWKAELEVQLWPDRLEIRFPPLVKRRIPLNELRGAQARRYRPILEYGGWGVRYGLYGRAYSVRGNAGVQLELTSGASLLIGSQRAEELAQALAEAVQARYGRRLKGS